MADVLLSSVGFKLGEHEPTAHPNVARDCARFVPPGPLTRLACLAWILDPCAACGRQKSASACLLAWGH
eukprot:1669548-Prymnesium_polylepis.1